MPVPTLISQLSTTPSSNSPSGSESTITNDDYLRTLSAFLAQVRDGVGITPTASITFPAGSSAAPSVTFVGDTDTGIYSPAANQVAVALNGAQVVSFAAATAGTTVTQINQPASAIGVRITSDAGVPFMAFRDRSINAATHTIGAIGFDAYRDISDPSYVAGIRCEGNTPAGNTGDLVFSTGGNAGTGLPPDRLRINYLGGVIINAPIPATGQPPLRLITGDATQPTLVTDTNSNVISPYLRFRRNAAIDDGLIGSVGTVGALVVDSGAGDVVLRSESAAVRISTNGGTSTALAVLPGGRVYGTGLHNNGSVSGTANQYIASGTYTPTMTGVLNVSAANGLKSQWMRVGNVVTVSGSCQITTAAATTTSCGMELPIPSNLASPGDCIGTIQQNIGTPVAGLLSLAGDTVNDRANITFTAVAASNNTYYFTFTYEVL